MSSAQIELSGSNVLFQTSFAGTALVGVLTDEHCKQCAVRGLLGERRFYGFFCGRAMAQQGFYPISHEVSDYLG